MTASARTVRVAAVIRGGSFIIFEFRLKREGR